MYFQYSALEFVSAYFYSFDLSYMLCLSPQEISPIYNMQMQLTLRIRLLDLDESEELGLAQYKKFPIVITVYLGLTKFTNVFLVCKHGFYGPNCDIKCPCESHSKCNPYNGTCWCSLGFTGERCSEGMSYKYYSLMLPDTKG